MKTLRMQPVMRPFWVEDPDGTDEVRWLPVLRFEQFYRDFGECIFPGHVNYLAG